MKDEATTMPGDAQLEAYILGSLPEGVAKALEDEVFTEDGAFERLQMAEERLLERYADGALDADARARLEARLLATPEGQRRLALTQALDQRGHAARVPWWRRRWTLGAAVSGVAVAAILLFVVIPSLPTTVTLAPSALRAASGGRARRRHPPAPPGARSRPPPPCPSASPPARGGLRARLAREGGGRARGAGGPDGPAQRRDLRGPPPGRRGAREHLRPRAARPLSGLDPSRAR